MARGRRLTPVITVAAARSATMAEPGTPSGLLQQAVWSWQLPVAGLAQYFGHRAGAYFAFLDVYTRSLVLPAAAVAMLWTLRPRPYRARIAARVVVAFWELGVVRRLSPSTLLGLSRPSRKSLFSELRALVRSCSGTGLEP